jgi:hypothetical protein
LSASIIDRLRIETGVNPNIHVMHVVLDLNPTESGKIVGMTSSNQAGVTFAPLTANPPEKRCGGLNVSGQIPSRFWHLRVRDYLNSLLL